MKSKSGSFERYLVETSDGLGLKGRLSRLNIIIEVSDSAEISRKHTYKIIRYPPNYVFPE